MKTPLKCVVDASVNIKQFIPDPLSSKVQQLFAHLNQPETEFYIPDLFYVESANALWKYIRAGQYTEADAARDLASLKTLPLQVFSTADLMEAAIIIAVTHKITVYDGVYVALSVSVDAPLLTLDQKLLKALTNTPILLLTSSM
ncbi:MAG: type II toxin-antitoxin system VapC family toxin [Microcystaceae cyanobacterium]